jgi:hypothetical protein
MAALLTITHHQGAGESYVLECPHGSTNGEAATSSIEPRERLISSLLARHGVPFGCTCAAETDLLDAYPSVESAAEQIEAGSSHGLAELDHEMKVALLQRIGGLSCSTCRIAVMVLPLHMPLVVVPVHDVACPNARWARNRNEKLA